MFNQPPDNQTPNGQPSGAADGQPIDWEKRFKGLQGEYQRLQKAHEETVTALKGKEDYATQLQAQFNDLKAARASEAATVQGQITQLQADLEAARAAAAQIEKEKADLLIQNQALAAAKLTRQRLVEAGADDLIGWYEKGRLNVDGLEGEALTTAINDFRADLDGYAQKRVQTTLAGTPAPSLATPKPVNMTDKAAMEAWLNNPRNANSPDFETIYDQYLSLKE